MYAITTHWTKSRLGGKRECTVYYLTNRNGEYIENVTNEIAEKYAFKQNKRGNIIVHCGSGTGYMVISSKIRAADKNAHTVDTSIF